jgi:hypothetical protein
MTARCEGRHGSQIAPDAPGRKTGSWPSPGSRVASPAGGGRRALKLR